MKSIKQIKKEQKDALTELIEFVGGQSKLADGLDVSKQVVHGWVKRGRISAQYALIVEEKTAGLFTKDKLRPDVKAWEV